MGISREAWYRESLDADFRRMLEEVKRTPGETEAEKVFQAARRMGKLREFAEQAPEAYLKIGINHWRDPAYHDNIAKAFTEARPQDSLVWAEGIYQRRSPEEVRKVLLPRLAVTLEERDYDTAEREEGVEEEYENYLWNPAGFDESLQIHSIGWGEPREYVLDVVRFLELLKKNHMQPSIRYPRDFVSPMITTGSSSYPRKNYALSVQRVISFRAFRYVPEELILRVVREWMKL